MSDLSKGWIEISLFEVGKIITGKTPSKNNPKDWGSEYNFITPTDIKDDSKFIDKTNRLISEEGKNRFQNMIIDKHSIIVTCIGSDMGKVVMNKNIALTNQQINSIIVNATFDKDFIYYKLKSKYKLLKRLAGSGSTMPLLNKSDFSNIKITIPESLDEQKAIANILSSFDKKIELLKEQNQTLETMAGAIFKEWFVEFNYPNATGEMIDSEMGEIPKGWRVGKLGDEFDVTIGRTPPRKESKWFSEVPQGMKWASIKDMRNAGVYIFNTSEYIVDEAIAKFNIPIIPENTAILSFKMTVGKVSITTEKMLSNEAIAHMKIKKDSYLTSEYIYLFLLNLNFNTLGSTSSIVTAINTAIIKKIKFLVPDKISMNNFNNLIIPIFKKIKTNSSQIQTLEKTRDSLLPKLMSGEVRVEV